MHEESQSYSGAPPDSYNFLSSEFTRKMNLNSKIDSVKEDKKPSYSYIFKKFQIE